MSAPTSKSPEEREFVVVSRASFTRSKTIIRIMLRFTLLLKLGQRGRPLPYLQRKENSSLTSEHQCTWWEKKRLKLRCIWYFAKIHEPHCEAYSQWRRAHKRGSTNVRSRSKSIRDSAIIRRNACCSIAWKTLRRPRTFLWVCKRSKTTIDQRG